MGLFDSFKGKPKNKFSLENLQYLHQFLLKHPVVNEQNKNLLIETLRQLSEVLIWGDQHNPQFFDFFLEKNVFPLFLKVLAQRTTRDVKIQVIQAVSILIENTGKQNSLYYLFSNNFVNELITHKFDFSDDELLAYYISLLKTISLKLNPNTIHFFFNETENDFPLYTEAIKFFNHKESMIRIAVRTLTLNVYKVEDESMRKFIMDKTAAPYFSNIVWYLRDQCYNLDGLVNNSTHANRSKLEDFVAELLDFFFYLHDIFNLGISALSEVLSEHLLQCLLIPQFVGSLTKDVELEDRLSPQLAVFLLAQTFFIFTYKPLVNSLAATLVVTFRSVSVKPNGKVPTPLYPLFCTSPLLKPISPKTTRLSKAHRYSSPNLARLEMERNHPGGNLPKSLEFSRSEGQNLRKEIFEEHANHHRTESVKEMARKHKRNKYYDTILSYLTEDDRLVLSDLCLLYGIMKNAAVEPELLELSGLLPRRVFKAKRLLDALTSSSLFPTTMPTSPKHHRSVSENDLGFLAISQRSHSAGPTTRNKNMSKVREEEEQKKENKKKKRESTIDVFSLLNSEETDEASPFDRDSTGKNNLTDEGTATLSTSNNNSSSEVSGLAESPPNEEEHEEEEEEEEGDPVETSKNTPRTVEELSEGNPQEDPADSFGTEETSSSVSEGASPSPSPPSSPKLLSNSTNEEERRGTSSPIVAPRRSPLANSDYMSSSTPGIISRTSNLKRVTSSSLGKELSNHHHMAERISSENSHSEIPPHSHSPSEAKQYLGQIYKRTVWEIAEKLLEILSRSDEFRLITLQLTIVLLKELVYIQDSTPNLNHDQQLVMNRAYCHSVNNLKQYFDGPRRELFLELFENELRTFRQLNFENLISDAATLLLPVSHSSVSGIALAKRLPSGEAEKVQKAVQAFLVLREFVFTMLKRKDDRLPLKEEMETYKLKDSVNLESKDYLPTNQLVNPNKRRVKRFLVLEPGSLLILEPPIDSTKQDPKISTNVPKTTTNVTTAMICNIVPLQNVEVEVDKSDPEGSTLHVVSHPITWSATFNFEDPTKAQQAHQQIEKAKTRFRDAKMNQIETMLNDQL